MKQTNKQLMERVSELTIQRDGSQERDKEHMERIAKQRALIESRDKLINILELELVKHEGRLPHFAVVVVFMLLSLAAGLYIGHKITQRGQPQKCALVHEGSIITNRVDTFMVGEVWNVLCCLETNSPASAVQQPKRYQPISHMKGAERLRL